METFGEYEVVEEISSNSVSTVYQARKAGGTARFAIKLRHVRRHLPTGETEHTPLGGGHAHELGEAIELSFLEAAKLQRRASEAGGANIAPVRGLAIDERGAWAVIDHFKRGSIRNWINLQQRVNSAELAWLVRGIVQGLLALRRAGGRTHGNLKPSNVLLGGRPGASLRNTPIFITDPLPGVVSAEESERDDLRGLGLIIYQLVHLREVGDDDWLNLSGPLSEEWTALGEEAGRWRELCSRLLDSRLSLDQTSIESLAAEFGSAADGGGTGKWLKIAAVLVAVCLLGGGVYGVMGWKARQNDANYLVDLNKAKQLAEAKKFLEAREKVASALKRKPGDRAATELQKKIEGQIESAFTFFIAAGQANLKTNGIDAAQTSLDNATRWRAGHPRVIELSNQIVGAREKVKKNEEMAKQRQELSQLLETGKSHATNRRWKESTNSFSNALTLAKAVGTPAQVNIAESGLYEANQMLAAMNAGEKLRDSIQGLRDAAAKARQAKGWQQGVDSLELAQDEATKLGDQKLLAEVNRELKVAKDGLKVFLAEKDDRNKISDLMEEGAKFESTPDLPKAMHSYSNALVQARILKDDGVIRSASNAFIGVDQLLKNQMARTASEQAIDRLLASGTKAISTNNWGQATNDLIQAISIARDIKDPTREKQAEAALAGVKKRESDWTAKKSVRDNYDRLFADGEKQANSGQWLASSNVFYQAKTNAVQLGDKFLTDKATAGISDAVAALRGEAEQKQFADNATRSLNSADTSMVAGQFEQASTFLDAAEKEIKKMTGSSAQQPLNQHLGGARASLTTKIQERAQAQIMNTAYGSAENLWKDGDYPKALAELNAKALEHPQYKALFDKINFEHAALTNAYEKLGNADYSLISDVDAYNAKEPFIELLRTARREKQRLDAMVALKTQPDGWRQVKAQLADLGSLSNKKTFADLSAWAKEQESNWGKLAEGKRRQLDELIGNYAVMFNCRDKPLVGFRKFASKDTPQLTTGAKLFQPEERKKLQEAARGLENEYGSYEFFKTNNYSQVIAALIKQFIQYRP